ncbi:class A beta-lactamase-related serine hydrolase [Saccharothrix obliqua]|uniref:class A beta-lactamase-related serine hydrolase n=1 Tax=Saccharothrix obliqua TaxID=2861747 RepID=UPI001C5FF13C|nr:class A beta-lactamase-related serine hydrolase [Saccharothrix obliqua]MBW4721695.1 class A beta-lactamase-related serine hydrolase [Saccharothrix obliqua]
MLLTRRHLLSACGAVGGALLLPIPTAAADPRPGSPAVVLDDGRGGRLAHHAHEPRPLGGTVRLLHLAAYGLALDRGLAVPGEPVRVGDWERYRSPFDDGHAAALRALDLKSTNGSTADDPNARVSLADLVGVLAEHGDHAAADYLRHRLGDDVLRAAAGRSTFPVPDLLGDALHAVLGRPVTAEQYVGDPRLQLEVIGRRPDAHPPAGTGGLGTAAELHRLLRSAGRSPGVAGHPGRARVLGDAWSGGFAVWVRWSDGRVGTAVVLTGPGAAGDLVGAVRSALLDPAALHDLRASLG